jgi:hypothetical protein
MELEHQALLTTLWAVEAKPCEHDTQAIENLPVHPLFS